MWNPQKRTYPDDSIPSGKLAQAQPVSAVVLFRAAAEVCALTA